MKAIIPVAGIGKRLRPHTFVTPKVLLNVGGKPMLSHIIDKAIDAGIDDIAFIIGYKGALIREFVTSHYRIGCRFYQQENTLGLAHAISLAAEYLVDEPVFIILGDTIFDVDLAPVFAEEFSSLGVKEVDDPRRFGTAELDETGYITRLVEKPQHPKSNLILVGQITDAFQIMLDRGEKIRTFPVEGWYDCGKRETILSTNRFLLSQSNREYTIDGTLIRQPVFIDETADVKNSIIGPNATVSKGAVIHNAIIVNTLVGEESTVTDISIRDSIIGNRAQVSGSSRSMNISDYSEIEV